MKSYSSECIALISILLHPIRYLLSLFSFRCFPFRRFKCRHFPFRCFPTFSSTFLPFDIFLFNVFRQFGNFHIFADFFATVVLYIFRFAIFFRHFFLRDFSHYSLCAIFSFGCFDKIHCCYSFEGAHFQVVVTSVIAFGGENSYELWQHFFLSKNIVTRSFLWV